MGSMWQQLSKPVRRYSLTTQVYTTPHITIAQHIAHDTSLICYIFSPLICEDPLRMAKTLYTKVCCALRNIQQGRGIPSESLLMVDESLQASLTITIVIYIYNA